jgi:hypothetical protein
MKQWVTRPWGGRKKFSVCLEDEKRKTIGAKNKKLEKTESRTYANTPGRVKGEGYGRRAQASTMASKNKLRVQRKTDT